MPLTIGVPNETADGETRVALVPDVVRRLTDGGAEDRGLNVVVEEGAGEGAYHADEDFADAGAEVASREEVLGAEVVAIVAPLPEEEIRKLSDGQVLVGLLDPLGAPERIRTLAEVGATALSMELVPRISRAQKMDALSAMSSLAGYRAALIGAHALPKFFPLLTTAAGTIRPAQVLVLGAGVAGLQAIATAQRLGAQTKGYDIREATREEVRSLGADFVDLEADIAGGEGEGGYAKELGEEIQERQPELLAPHVAEADVVISTALIPGGDAPVLVSEEAVETMAPGSVVVDLAAPGGGNCALTEAGETVREHGVQVFGPTNLPAEMPVHASQLYARTVAALVQAFVGDDGAFAPDFDDDVFAGACVAHDGDVRAERVREALGLPAREEESAKEGKQEKGAGEEAQPEATHGSDDASGDAARVIEGEPSGSEAAGGGASGSETSEADDETGGAGEESTSGMGRTEQEKTGTGEDGGSGNESDEPGYAGEAQETTFGEDEASAEEDETPDDEWKPPSA
ncbi:MAG: NAD(P)(+) transhydrogenase (Re/Si-specific) subunit alpha [Bacteroidetes bacterium QS_9_68_14]|nr:MAG: NAD(P)(+) transhydrogenase (Re/Si-specific) subunit alpha [Bacteroidetes bacterium QS_9_68_14]